MDEEEIRKTKQEQIRLLNIKLNELLIDIDFEVAYYSLRTISLIMEDDFPELKENFDNNIKMNIYLDYQKFKRENPVASERIKEYRKSLTKLD